MHAAGQQRQTRRHQKRFDQDRAFHISTLDVASPVVFENKSNSSRLAPQRCKPGGAPN
jgi:hypothetical protein